ncbi:DUF1641 domain-containing protein [Desulfovibrio desulfuricans]|uniref:DUF1641 domain-containing protein n=1 Tax=Desulfovibrio desulfuricans TaxID=876 RepID=A0A4P7UNE2_DESDE|nr:DUF1641 domain-containing protein [Desulfovibrio desulfuricans]QCC86311.1 DUF1641 domain-containing protein [Desulfovibrio desulfuricans]
MTPEDKILERLAAIEDKLSDLQQSKENSRMLMEQLTPIGNHAFRLMVEEMETLNGRVTLDDILALGRKGLLTVPKLTWLLDQLENAADLWNILHPAVAPTFPHIIEKMGAWEKDGVFEKMSAFKSAGGNLLGSMSPEDIANTGEGLTFLVSQLQRLADPDLQARITKLMAMLGEIDMDSVKPTGVLGLFGTLCSAEGRQSLGLLAELIKITGKAAGQNAAN